LPSVSLSSSWMLNQSLSGSSSSFRSRSRFSCSYHTSMNWIRSSSSYVNQNLPPSVPSPSVSPTSRNYSLGGQSGLLSWLLPCRPALLFCSGVFLDTDCSRPIIPRFPLPSRHVIVTHPLCPHSYISVLYPCSFRLFTTYLRETLSLPPTRLVTECNLELCVCRRTSDSPLFWFTFIIFTLMEGVVWYHLASVEVINTARGIGQADHIMQQSEGSCGSPSGPNVTPGGSSPMISVGGAPCSCISFISDTTLRHISGLSSE